MFRRLLLAVVLLIAVMGTTAPAAHVATPVHAAPAAIHAGHAAALFDKTRVIVHLAIAYGVFHHWVWKPFKAGDISIHHPIKLVKAGLAILFAVHELKKAYAITSTSKSGTLQKINEVLTVSIKKFTDIGNRLHQNPASLTDSTVSGNINDLNNQVNLSNAALPAPDAPVAQLGSFS